MKMYWFIVVASAFAGCITNNNQSPGTKGVEATTTAAPTTEVTMPGGVGGGAGTKESKPSTTGSGATSDAAATPPPPKAAAAPVATTAAPTSAATPSPTLTCEPKRYVFLSTGTHRIHLNEKNMGKAKEASLCTEPSPGNECRHIESWSGDWVINVVSGHNRLAVWYREDSPSGDASTPCEGQVSAANFVGNNNFRVSFTVTK